MTTVPDWLHPDRLPYENDGPPEGTATERLTSVTRHGPLHFTAAVYAPWGRAWASCATRRGAERWCRRELTRVVKAVMTAG